MDGIDREAFIRRDGDRPIVVPCVGLVLFLDLTDDGGLIDFYDRCREALGDRLTHYQAQGMNGFRPIDKRAEGKVHAWFGQPSVARTPNYYLQMSDGDPNERSSASLLHLQIYRRPYAAWTAEARAAEVERRLQAIEAGRFVTPRLATKLRVTLPLDHPLTQPATLRTWVLGFKTLRDEPVFSGYAGLALNYYDQLVNARPHYAAQAALEELCSRYPGFDWDGGAPIPRMLRFEPAQRHFLPLVKRANWLTLLCDTTVNALGGRRAVRASVREPGIEIVELAHGLALQAGPGPRTGDIESGAAMPEYRCVAMAVRPVRVPEIDGFNGPAIGKAFANRWLNAFDD